jgi:SAM-dependent methyltransferase
MTLLGDVRKRSVLDIGCGTGLLLQYRQPGFYLGIDPSEVMLAEMRKVWPRAMTYHTPLQSFVPPQSEHCTPYRFDVVCGLFGVGSYLHEGEVRRVPSLVAKGGQAVMMFYRRDYEPATHTMVHGVAYYDHFDILDEVFPGHTMEYVDGHAVLIWRKHG